MHLNEELVLFFSFARQAKGVSSVSPLIENNVYISASHEGEWCEDFISATALQSMYTPFSLKD